MALGPLDGARVVDLYSGSGALAIEALSRGAAWADMVDADRHARDAAHRNLEELGLLPRSLLLRVLMLVWSVLLTLPGVGLAPG